MQEFITNFGENSKCYRKYRPQYPIKLFEKIFSMSPSFEKAIDLGAGTGISTQMLAKKFKYVDVIEPDEKMLIDVTFPNNVKIFNVTSEQYIFIPKDADVITAGNSFYWMNADILLPYIYSCLKIGGVFAAYRYDFPVVEDNKIQSIITKELYEKWNVFRNERLVDTDYTYRKISQFTGFSKTEKVMIPNIIEMNINQLVGFLLSTSYCSAYLNSIDNAERYVNDFKQKMLNVCDKENIKVNFEIELVMAIR